MTVKCNTLPEGERTKQADKHAMDCAQPILRDMYPSRSRGQMFNEFRHSFLCGWDAAVEQAGGSRDAAAMRLDELKDLRRKTAKLQIAFDMMLRALDRH